MNLWYSPRSHMIRAFLSLGENVEHDFDDAENEEGRHVYVYLLHVPTEHGMCAARCSHSMLGTYVQ